jgi:hypothetical protein
MKFIPHSSSLIHSVEGGDHITTLAKPEFATALIEFLRSNKQE